ncbi:MAG: YggS family pyridoxal phosphate-dependent enzyme, partial [Candidatus Hydrogenedentota bacterium]
RLGVLHFGENRVEQAGEKPAALGTGVVWHMIGNVQRRKVRDVAQRFDRIDAVDRLELAEAIDTRAAELGKTMPVLIEVNISGESTKYGFAPDELDDAIAKMKSLLHLCVEGLMTMAPLADDIEEARPVFRALKELADRYGLPIRSMGMTNDFEIAIEEGATEVRIGTALFQ